MPDTRHRTRLEAAALGLRLAEALAGFADSDALAFPARFAAFVGLGEDALAAARDDATHPLDRIAGLASDGATLVDLALLTCLPEVHEGFAALLRLFNRDARPEASVALALQWLEAESDDALACRDGVEDLLLHAPVAPLGLLRCAGDGPWHGRALRPGPGLWAALNDRAPEAELLPGFRSVPGLEAWLAQPDVRRALAALGQGTPALIALTGQTQAVRATRLRALLGQLGLGAVRAALHAGDDAATRGDAARDAISVAFLHRAVPWLDLSGDAEAPSPALPRGLVLDAPIVVTAEEERAIPPFDLPVLPLRLAPLPATARRRMWGALLPQLEPATLAARYPVEPEEARGIVADLALRQATGAGPLGQADIADALRTRTATHARPGVRRVVPRAGWSDLLLPQQAASQLADAVLRVRAQLTVLDDWGFAQDRGDRRGTRLLFHGPPGTGKTLAAEAIAHALGLDLLVADIAGLVSKWIGETEKNLAAVFELAERARAVLFFDEADALFGRRTEAQDSHDRYANLETAYLLQRLERFQGVAILATNLRGNLDPAFTRRFDDIVGFVEPDVAMRARLWQLHIPAAAPLGPDVDLGELAEWYALSGAQIRNAALGAAYLAAAAPGTRIAQDHLLTAVAREFEKAGRAWPGRPPAHPALPAPH
ncbi:AAA family ATPase [Falsiroseomonas sp. HW251]|uniref:AAA family ATPase n=1 Tax=Falsiroseomonas sp. HW251 TaxID=3390998 RepID=UPI003D31F10E